jgi:predicted ATPase
LHPFNIPALKQTYHLNPDHLLTIFVGENGSGKSNLLLALAYHVRSICVFGGNWDSFLKASARVLLSKIRIKYINKAQKGFFLG